jgi:zinc finger HIT domain-containing protein 3
LSEHKDLPDLLSSLDKIRGSEREYAIQDALGMDDRIDVGGEAGKLGEGAVALRALATAVEEAVRGGKQDALGLDWD